MIYVHSISRAVQYYPEHTAFVRNGNPISFRTLDRRVRTIAAELRDLGFLRGDRLAFLLPNEFEYIELIYACSLLGVIAVPINTRYAVPEIDHVLADARPKGLIRHSSLPKPTQAMEWERILDQQPFDNTHDPYTLEFYEPDALLVLIYTSGTTGQPKGAALTHSNVFANIHDLHYWLGYRERAVYLHASPMFHIADFPALFAAPVFGAAQDTLHHFQPDKFCEAVQSSAVTHTILVPTMINSLCNFDRIGEYKLDTLEVLSYGGSPIAPALIEKVRKILPGMKLLQVYGLSETGFLTGLEDGEHLGSRVQSCGRTCPGVDLKVLKASGESAEVREMGELVARGPGIMLGYWNDLQEEPFEETPSENETTIELRGGFFHTGDIGYQDEEGFFFIVDRAKDMIVTGGENVYSREVEDALSRLSEVKEAAVFGIPDAQWGELVAAAVVLKQGNSLSAEDLMRCLKGVLAGYKVPRHIEFLDCELPKSGSGKILKRTLRDKYWVDKTRNVG